MYFVIFDPKNDYLLLYNQLHFYMLVMILIPIVEATATKAAMATMEPVAMPTMAMKGLKYLFSNNDPKFSNYIFSPKEMSSKNHRDRRRQLASWFN